MMIYELLITNYEFVIRKLDMLDPPVFTIQLQYSSNRLLIYSPNRLLVYSSTRLLVYSSDRLLVASF